RVAAVGCRSVSGCRRIVARRASRRSPHEEIGVHRALAPDVDDAARLEVIGAFRTTFAPCVGSPAVELSTIAGCPIVASMLMHSEYFQEEWKFRCMLFADRLG